MCRLRLKHPTHHKTQAPPLEALTGRPIAACLARPPFAWLPTPPRGTANASVAHCHSAARSLPSGSGLGTKDSCEKRWNAAAGSGAELLPPAALPQYGAPALARPPPRPAPGTGRGELAARSWHCAAVTERRAEPGGHGEESAPPWAALRRAPAVVGCRGCRSRGGGGIGWGGVGEGGGWPEVTRRRGAAWPRLWCSGDRRAGGAGTGGCVPLARRWVRTCPSPRLRADTGGGQAGPGSGLGRAASPVPALSRAAPRRAGLASPRRTTAEGMEPPGVQRGCHSAVRRHGARHAAQICEGRLRGSEWPQCISVLPRLLQIACVERESAHVFFAEPDTH